MIGVSPGAACAMPTSSFGVPEFSDGFISSLVISCTKVAEDNLRGKSLDDDFPHYFELLSAISSARSAVKRSRAFDSERSRSVSSFISE